METIKPIKIGSKKTSVKEKLTAPEMGKLWATYMGNSMSSAARLQGRHQRHRSRCAEGPLPGNGL